MTDQFSTFFVLTKIDEEKREVWGRATEQVPDAVNEIMDYTTSAPRFRKWSDDALKRTAILPEQSRSMGNIREMHEPIAAGKAIALECNDTEKAIDIGTVCVDDSTWNKIKKGVLTGFSVGGKYAKRWLDPGNPQLTRYTADPLEISYVDSPAVPTATYKLIKANGIEELHKVGEPTLDNITPDEHEGVPALSDVEKVESGAEVKEVPQASGFVSPDLIDQRAVAPIDEPRTDPVAKAEQPEWVGTFTTAVKELVALKKASDEEKASLEAKLKAIGSRVGIARRDGEPLTPPQDYPASADDYGDPANYSWPFDTTARAQSAMAYFNGGKGKGKYAATEWNVLGRRIATRASTLFSAKYQYSPTDKKVERTEAIKMADLTKDAMSGLISQLQAGIKAGVDLISKDPAAAQAMFMQVLGDLEGSKPDTTATPSSSNPTAPSGTDQPGAHDATLKATMPETPMTATVTATPTPTTADKATVTVAPSSSSSDSSGSSSSSSSSMPDTTAAYQAMMDKRMETLTETVAKLAEMITAKTAQPVEKGVTIGDLQAMLTVQQPTEDPVIKALTSGDPYALQKAAKLAGSENAPDVHAVYQKIDQAVNDSLRPLFTRQMIAKGYNHYNPGQGA